MKHLLERILSANAAVWRKYDSLPLWRKMPLIAFGVAFVPGTIPLLLGRMMIGILEKRKRR